VEAEGPGGEEEGAVQGRGEKAEEQAAEGDEVQVAEAGGHLEHEAAGGVEAGVGEEDRG
jgi:hypothetical protein